MGPNNIKRVSAYSSERIGDIQKVLSFQVCDEAEDLSKFFRAFSTGDIYTLFKATGPRFATIRLQS